MVDVNIVVGFLVTWLIRKSQPKFKDQRRSQDVDEALENLARIATGVLPQSMISRMQTEVDQTTRLRPRTKDQLVAILATAVQDEPDFARTLDETVNALRSIVGETTDPEAPEPSRNVINTSSGTVHGTVYQIGRVSGDVTIGPLDRDR